MTTRKIYIQSAGIYRDFNWKCAGDNGAYTQASPGPEGMQAYRSLSNAQSKAAVCRILCADGSYCAVARNLYVPDKWDYVKRPIYLNICISGISNQEARAFETAFHQNVANKERRDWPAITRHYLTAEEDFDMDWAGLHESLDEILKTPGNPEFSLSDELRYEEEAPPSPTMSAIIKAGAKAILHTSMAYLISKIDKLTNK